MKFNSNDIRFEYYAIVEDLLTLDGKKYIVTDESGFYAEAGGQLSDKGTIGPCEIINVIEQDGRILCETDDFKGLRRGELAECRIDKEKRLDYSTQHTGQHLLSAVLENDFGIKTVSFHMAEDVSTIDTDMPLREELRNEVIEKVMQHIDDDIKIERFIKKKEEIDRLGLRKIVEAQGDIQLIKIGDVDFSACCGTHLSSTGSLRLFNIRKIENYKGGSRIYFIFGKRAMNDYAECSSIVSSVKAILGVHETEIPFRVGVLTERENEAREDLKALRERIVRFLYEKDEFRSDFVFRVLDDDEEIIKGLVDLMNSDERNFVITDKRENRMYASVHREGLNLGKLFRDNKKGKIRGGGGSTSVQAVSDDSQEILDFSYFFKELIQSGDFR